MVAALERRSARPASSATGTPTGATCCGLRWSGPVSRSRSHGPASTCGAGRDDDGWATVDWLAGHGILVAPGDFYGPAGAPYVRVALTATDERIEAAAERLSVA